MFITWSKIKRLFLFLTTNPLYVKDAILRKFLLRSMSGYYPPILRFFTIINFVLLNISSCIFCFLLYKGQITFSHLGATALGIWAYASYLIDICCPEARNKIFHFDFSENLNSRGKNVFEKIKKLTEREIWFIYMMFFMAAFMNISLLPIFENDDKLMYPLSFSRYYLNQTGRFVFEIVFCFFVFHILFFLVTQSFFNLYGLLQLIFQLYLLNDRIFELVNDNLGFWKSPLLVENENYQKRIKEYLIRCVKQQVIIKKYHSYIQELSFYRIIIYAHGAIMVVGINLFYILTDDRKIIILRYLSLGVLCLTYAINISICGEEINIQDERWYRLLTNCPWHLWNKENKQILLFMMVNSSKPLTVSASNFIIVNATLTLNVIKSIYAILMWLLTLVYRK